MLSVNMDRYRHLSGLVHIKAHCVSTCRLARLNPTLGAGQASHPTTLPQSCRPPRCQCVHGTPGSSPAGHGQMIVTIALIAACGMRRTTAPIRHQRYTWVNSRWMVNTSGCNVARQIRLECHKLPGITDQGIPGVLSSLSQPAWHRCVFPLPLSRLSVKTAQNTTPRCKSRVVQDKMLHSPCHHGPCAPRGDGASHNEFLCLHRHDDCGSSVGCVQML